MKLTLGQAAKEAGISKPSLSAAIKKGRVSANKNESGVYEIDPAELFRVYPKKGKANPLDNSGTLSEANTKKTVSLGGKDEVLNLLLAERDKLLEEKDKSIKRLQEEKEALRTDLEDQKKQSERITLLLENKSTETDGVGAIQKSLSMLEERINKQEESAKLKSLETDEVIQQEKQRAEEALAEKQDYKNTVKLLYVLTGILLLLFVGAAFSGMGNFSIALK